MISDHGKGKVFLFYVVQGLYSETRGHCLLLHSQYVARREELKVYTKRNRMEIRKKMKNDEKDDKTPLIAKDREAGEDSGRGKVHRGYLWTSDE